MKCWIRGALWVAGIGGILLAAVENQAVAGAVTDSARTASSAHAAQLRRTRILVVGATGRNGSAIVAALEGAGARPRLMARDVARAREKFPGDRDWIEADVTRPETLTAAVRDIDVIINAVATSELEGPNGVEAVDLGGMRNLLAAAKGTAVRRMVFITGMMVGRDSADWLPIMRKGFGAKREAERLLIGSGLEYVILRPTGILNRPGNRWAIGIYPQSQYQVNPEELRMRASGPLPGPDEPPPRGTIARTDLAEVAIVSAVDRGARNRVFVVSHADGPASAAWSRQLAQMPRQ